MSPSTNVVAVLLAAAASSVGAAPKEAQMSTAGTTGGRSAGLATAGPEVEHGH